MQDYELQFLIDDLKQQIRELGNELRLSIFNLSERIKRLEEIHTDDGK
jgi:hypothetical protein